jgi:hypothetical protein
MEQPQNTQTTDTTELLRRKAGILNHSRRELMEKATVIPTSRLLDDDPTRTIRELYDAHSCYFLFSIE